MKRMLLLISLWMLTQLSFAAPSGLLFNVAVTSGTLTINTTIPHHTYPSAGIKINTPGYQFANTTDCTMNANGYCIFSANNTTKKTIAFTGTGGTSLSVNLCLSGVNKVSCQQFTNLPLPLPTTPTARVATGIYVTSAGGAVAVYYCTLNATTGALATCVDAGQDGTIGAMSPQDIVLNQAGTIAYLQGFGTPGLAQCTINSSTGLLSSCTAITVTTPTGYYPYYGMLTINSTDTFAYLADYNSGVGRILACPIVDGVLSGTCTDTGATNVSYYASQIALNPTNTTAYIANYSGSPEGVLICAVNGATFSNCISKTGDGVYTFLYPGGVALNPNLPIVYVSDYGANLVYACSTAANSTANFNSCAIAGPISNPWGITVNELGTYAYVANYSSDVFACPILADGTFGTCVADAIFTESTNTAVRY